MKRAQRDLIAKVDALLAHTLAQIRYLDDNLRLVLSTEERLGAAKLGARLAQDARRLIRLKVELLNGQPPRFVKQAQGPPSET